MKKYKALVPMLRVGMHRAKTQTNPFTNDTPYNDNWFLIKLIQFQTYAVPRGAWERDEQDN
jgi:hypothetical protein